MWLTSTISHLLLVQNAFIILNLCILLAIDVNLVLANIIVLECDGQAEVCITITDGILAINVTVLLTTDDDSATGKYILMHLM